MELLEGQTLQDIGDVLGVHRSTILRDLRVLDAVEAEYLRLMREQPWFDDSPGNILRSAGYYPTPELAERSGYTQEYLAKLAREGKVRTEKEGGRWWISEDSLEEYMKGHEGPGPARGPYPK